MVGQLLLYFPAGSAKSAKSFNSLRGTSRGKILQLHMRQTPGYDLDLLLMKIIGELLTQQGFRMLLKQVIERQSAQIFVA